jgi:ELWxxDGT repeat protein
VNGVLFFIDYDPTSGGPGLWKSDGTATGTVLVEALPHLEELLDFTGELTNVNGTLFFRAWDPTHGTELWRVTARPTAPSS